MNMLYVLLFCGLSFYYIVCLQLCDNHRFVDDMGQYGVLPYENYIRVYFLIKILLIKIIVLFYRSMEGSICYVGRKYGCKCKHCCIHHVFLTYKFLRVTQISLLLQHICYFLGLPKKTYLLFAMKHSRLMKSLFLRLYT